MSLWTYINGTVTVCPIGRTQAEKRYVLETVLNHLPVVSGSEGDMAIHIVQKSKYDSSSSCDEFGEVTNNLVTRYGNKDRDGGWMQIQSSYILVVEAPLRDREFEETYRDFIKWLVRLGKRVFIEDILVEVKGYGKSSIIRNETIRRKSHWGYTFGKLFEDPTWCNDTGEPNWCEFMLWDAAKNSRYPMQLLYKYYSDEENDREMERRIGYLKGDKDVEKRS